MKKYDLIIMLGAPGSGKSTISEILQKKLDSPMIDFGKLREFHLDREWKKESNAEKEMTFENLIFILKNYIKHGYKNIIINDLVGGQATRLAKIFAKNKCLLITLVVEDSELARRVLSPRNSGFKNVKLALEWNKEFREGKPLKNEHVMDNSHTSPEKTVMEILNIIKDET